MIKGRYCFRAKLVDQKLIFGLENVIATFHSSEPKRGLANFFWHLHSKR